MKVKLFYKPQCPKCPQAKELVENYSNVEYLNVEEVDGLAEATYYGVMATPSIILLDNHDNEVCSWRGDVPEEEEFREWI